jgi:hypothetical protein
MKYSIGDDVTGRDQFDCDLMYVVNKVQEICNNGYLFVLGRGGYQHLGWKFDTHPVQVGPNIGESLDVALSDLADLAKPAPKVIDWAKVPFGTEIDIENGIAGMGQRRFVGMDGKNVVYSREAVSIYTMCPPSTCTIVDMKDEYYK